MKKLNLDNIGTELAAVKESVEEATTVGYEELVDPALIDLAESNNYADNDTAESILSLADEIVAVGLINPLGVVKEGNRYKLFAGERRYRAITTHLGWESIPCRVFEGISPARAKVMLHLGNKQREYKPEHRLALYEEYMEDLKAAKDAGEIVGGLQKAAANMLQVSDRQVRTYRMMSEQLTENEKAELKQGGMSFGDAKMAAKVRAEIQPEPLETVAEADGGTEKDNESAKSILKTEIDWDVVLHVCIHNRYNAEELYLYYVLEVPTPKEAAKEKLRPAHGYAEGSVELSSWGKVKCAQYNNNLTVETGVEKKVFSYSEIDAKIRDMIRCGQLVESPKALLTKWFQDEYREE